MFDLVPGPLALVGSGEYTRAMDDTDRELLLATRVAQPRVVVIPTASGLEPGMPENWNARGVAHFQRLGANVTPLLITERAHCYLADHIHAIDTADLIDFSGGNPNYVVETWRDTPALTALLDRWRSGAALAGCSAGAMMMGGYTIRVRDALATGTPTWTPALAIAPRLAVLPHFDRMRHFLNDDHFEAVLATAPSGITVIGVDEDTALIHTLGHWRVSGRQTVTVFDHSGQATCYPHGADIEQPLLAPIPFT